MEKQNKFFVPHFTKIAQTYPFFITFFGLGQFLEKKLL